MNFFKLLFIFSGFLSICTMCIADQPIQFDAYLTWTGYDGVKGEPVYIWNGEYIGINNLQEVINRIRDLKDSAIVLIYPKYPYRDDGESMPLRAYPFNSQLLKSAAKEKNVRLIFSHYDHTGKEINNENIKKWGQDWWGQPDEDQLGPLTY